MLPLTALMGFLLLSGIPAYAQAPAAATQPSYIVAMTAYNAVPEQTDGNPYETASGAYSNPEVVAARSQDLADELPFGTIIELDGPVALGGNCGYDAVVSSIGYRVIADTMNVRYTNRVDLLFSTKKEYRTVDKGMKNAAQVFGICKGVTIRVVGHVNINRIPKTQAELVKIVSGRSKNDLAIK